MPHSQNPDVHAVDSLHAQREEIERFIVAYRSAIDEIETKTTILRREFSTVHEYNPIEGVSSRLKTLDSLRRKADKRGLTGLAEIREHLEDIAGVRIVCSFVDDVYRVRDLLCAQADLRVRREKDYIKNPKPSGYRSLHIVVEVPVFLSSSTEIVPVEIQLRTIAMDFWASLEHKIYYKFAGQVPQDLRGRLIRAADTAARLDVDMQDLHLEMQELKVEEPSGSDPAVEQILRTISLFEREGR